MKYLDHGSFGVVMEDKNTVVKIMLDSCPDDVFRNEDAVLSRLPLHPGLPRYHGAILEPYRGLRMERARGHNLFDLINDGWLSYKEKCFLGRSIAETILALHNNGIVHGDLKPENIIVDKATMAHKLVDFGGAIDTASPEITPPKRSIGTLSYMASEVIGGERPTTASDMYSYGILIFVLFSRNHPSEFRRDLLPSFTTLEARIIHACTDKKSRRATAGRVLRMWDDRIVSLCVVQ
jgi:serine/threonine protein kinase